MTERIVPADAPYDTAVADDLARLMPDGLEPILLFRTLARNPRVLRRVRRGGLLDPGSLTLRQRELVILRATARAGAAYEWGVHVAYFAAAAGFDDELVHATVHLGPDAPCFGDDEAVIVRLCDELHDLADVTDATWGEVAARFDAAQQVELLVLAGQYRGLSGVVRAMRLPAEAGAPGFPEPRAAEPPRDRHEGSCLCGGVRYVVDGPLGAFGYCHCRSCQKASGSAHAANAPVDRAAVRFVERATLTEYASSPGKTRAFCGRCGSPIYARLDASPDVLRIRLGTLDTPLRDHPRAHTWVGERASWAPILDAVPQFERWAARDVLHQRGSRQPG